MSKTTVASWVSLLLALSSVRSSPASPAALLPASTPFRPSASASGHSFNPIFSADSHFIVFTSQAQNLAANDDQAPHLDVFLHDLTTDLTTLVSVNQSGLGGGNEDAVSPSISSNGNFIAFASAASNLSSNDTNNASDIFVRDIAAHLTQLVSRPANGTDPAQGTPPSVNRPLSSHPLISANARWIIFESNATNLVDLPDTNLSSDIFAHDLNSGATLLVSINASGNASGNGPSIQPDITPDGNSIAFISSATDLVQPQASNEADVFVRNLQLAITYWASRDLVDYLPSTSRCSNPLLSDDARYLVFTAVNSATNSPAWLFHHDLINRITTVVSSNTLEHAQVSLSADGLSVAYHDSENVYLWDAQTGLSSLVNLSNNSTDPLPRPAHTPVLTSNGSNVLFLTRSDLTSQNPDHISQLYFRSLAEDHVRLLSTNTNNLPSRFDIDVTLPAISPDGHLVAFECLDDSLVPDDLNHASDIFLHNLLTGTIRLMSRRHPDHPSATGTASASLTANAFSPDGNLLLYQSYDSNLAPQDTNLWQDVFARDLTQATNLPLSRLPLNCNFGFCNEEQPPRFGSGAFSRNPAISANGQQVVYLRQEGFSGLRLSFRQRLVLKNLQTDAFRIVSDIDYSPFNPRISSDGSWLAFQSRTVDPGLVATSLFNPNVFNIFFLSVSGHPRDRSTVISGDNDSINPVLSPNQQWLLFQSLSSSITINGMDSPLSSPNQPASSISQGSHWQLFAADLGDFPAQVTLLSRDPLGESLPEDTAAPAFSSDSRFVAFHTLPSHTLYLHDLQTSSSIEIISTNGLHPSLGMDGWLVAYQTDPNPTASSQIMLMNRRTGTLDLISASPDGNSPGNGQSSFPLLSHDGRFLVFQSRADNLTENDQNNAADIFLRDLWHHTTLLISRNHQGTGSGNGPSRNHIFSPDGRTIAFESLASDLVPGDFNERNDIFVVQIIAEDSDTDQMDDDWEVAYFGNLDRDGSGDFDEDGITDADEFRAGTIPGDDQSVLALLTVRTFSSKCVGNGSTDTILWRSSPGRTYRIQFKRDLNEPSWTELRQLIGGGPETAIQRVTAAGTTAAAVTHSGPCERGFYRILLEPAQ